MRRTGRILVCAAVLIGTWQCLSPTKVAAAGTTSAPQSMSHRYGDEHVDVRTPKERGARINGSFANDAVLDSATSKIRKDGAGRCDSVTTAVDAGAKSGAVICNGGKNAYFMQRDRAGWTYVAPRLIKPKNRPSVQK